MEKVIKRKTEIFRKLTPYRISLPCHFHEEMTSRFNLRVNYETAMHPLHCLPVTFN